MESDLVFGEKSALSDQMVELKPDIQLPDRISNARVTTSKLPGIALTQVTLDWNAERHTYALTSFGLEIEGKGGTIQTTDLRKLSAPLIVETVIRVAWFPEEVQAKLSRSSREFYRELRESGDASELQFWVARRAAVAQALYGAPNKEVMECFEVDQSTATRWIAKARRSGLLD